MRVSDSDIERNGDNSRHFSIFEPTKELSYKQIAGK
jgi:hypothetical protein